MALFLRGKYKGFYRCADSPCVRDIFRFNKTSETSISLQLTRRSMASILKKFWLLESSRFTLHPLDEEEPRQGGKVTVNSLIFDIRTFTIKFKTYYGIYGDDFIQYGEFKQGVDPLNDEELLLKITEDIKDSNDILQKSTFRFENDNLSFSHDVNTKELDEELHPIIPHNQLTYSMKRTWSETFFYGLGNKSM